PREGRRGPLVLHVAREPPPELPEVPRPRDPHGERAALELLVDVPDVVDAEHRGDAALVPIEIEIERPPERRLPERAVLAVVLQQGRAGLETEDHRDIPLVERSKERVVAASAPRLDGAHRVAPLSPRLGRLRIARLRQQILSIEQDAGIYVPGDPVQPAIHEVGAPDAGEVAR